MIDQSRIVFIILNEYYSLREYIKLSDFDFWGDVSILILRYYLDTNNLDANTKRECSLVSELDKKI
jgi:hypothetical protein